MQPTRLVGGKAATAADTACDARRDAGRLSRRAEAASASSAPEPSRRADMTEPNPAEAFPTDYVRVKRKRTTIFLYMEPADTVHDLRARVNHITKVPTTDIKFFIDKDGEVPVDENKLLADQKVQSKCTCCGALCGGWTAHALHAAREDAHAHTGWGRPGDCWGCARAACCSRHTPFCGCLVCRSSATTYCT